LDHSEQRY